MKTIEEKARAYDRAKDIMEKYLKSGNAGVIAENTIKNAFPELHENEDEIVKEELINYLKHRCNTTTLSGEERACNKWIAWLEKQSEQKSYGQREECIDCQFNYAGECKGSCTMKRSERKPADKVKPKFNISNWIINRTGATIMQIVNNEDFYESVEIGGQRRTDTYNYVERDFRLWSIEDAKDGDVLVHNGITFIFKGIEDGIVKGLCSELSDSILNFGEPEHDKDYYPATKEQRYFLFQKMKEAGYEWDAEKKELKKIVAPIFHIGDRVRYKGHSCDGIITEITNTDYICGNAKLPISTQDKLELVEQNPVEWKQENIEELTEFENAMMHIGGSFFGENAGLDPNDTATIKEQAELLLELAPKTEWSEEDEKMFRSLHNLIYVVRDCDCDSSKKKELSDWIEYLKNRMQPQEWSEEDEEMLRSIIATCELAEADRDSSPARHLLEMQLNWLKSIKPQKHWKPNEKQIKALHDMNLTGNISYAGQGQVLIELYNDLKKL